MRITIFKNFIWRDMSSNLRTEITFYASSRECINDDSPNEHFVYSYPLVLCSKVFTFLNIFFCIDALRPSQQFYSSPETISCLSGLNQY